MTKAEHLNLGLLPLISTDIIKTQIKKRMYNVFW